MADLKNVLPGRVRISQLVKFGFRILVAFALLTYGFCDPLWAGPELVSGRASKAPPQPPPIEHMLPQQASPGPKPLGITPYSIGQPTDEEQLYLEYLNRMRADPTAEDAVLTGETVEPIPVVTRQTFPRSSHPKHSISLPVEAVDGVVGCQDDIRSYV
jgi:hypothetical protein